METTLDFVRRLQDHFGNHTTYGVAKRLGVSTQAAQKWVNNGRTFDETTAIRAAEILGEDPAYVIACCHAERANNQEVKFVWERLGKLAKEGNFAGRAAALVVAAGLALGSPTDSYAAGFQGDNYRNLARESNKDYRK